MKLYTRIVVQILCLALAWTPLHPAQANPVHLPGPVDAQSLQARYPNARVIQVSAEAYPELEQVLRRSGYQPQTAARPLLLATAEQDSGSATPEPAPVQATVDCDGQPAATTDNDRVNVYVDVLNNPRSGGRGSGNDAAVVFVIVGAVVLVVWTLYAVKYLIDMGRGIAPCGGRWSEWGLTTTSINSYRPQYANFSGLRYLTGVKQDGLSFGLSAELGQADVLLAEAGSLRLQGTYWLLGPLLRWKLASSANPSYFQMEFLVGSTENQEMGVIAAAKLGFNFGISERLRLGISYGALNLNLHEQGIILDRSQFYTLWGLDMGYRF